MEGVWGVYHGVVPLLLCSQEAQSPRHILGSQVQVLVRVCVSTLGKKGGTQGGNSATAEIPRVI